MGVSEGPTRPAEFRRVGCGGSKPGRGFRGEMTCPGFGKTGDAKWLDSAGTPPGQI